MKDHQFEIGKVYRTRGGEEVVFIYDKRDLPMVAGQQISVPLMPLIFLGVTGGTTYTTNANGRYLADGSERNRDVLPPTERRVVNFYAGSACGSTYPTAASANEASIGTRIASAWVNFTPGVFATDEEQS